MSKAAASNGFRDLGRLWRRAGVSGNAVCFDGTGIIVEFIAGLFAAGESVDFIAEQYNLSRRDIEAGLRLVVSGAFTKNGGLRAIVERRMNAEIPLLAAGSTRTDPGVSPPERSGG